MSNRIGPTVKLVWKVAMHVQHNLFWVWSQTQQLTVESDTTFISFSSIAKLGAFVHVHPLKYSSFPLE